MAIVGNHGDRLLVVSGDDSVYLRAVAGVKHNAFPQAVLTLFFRFLPRIWLEACLMVEEREMAALFDIRTASLVFFVTPTGTGLISSDRH